MKITKIYHYENGTQKHYLEKHEAINYYEMFDGVEFDIEQPIIIDQYGEIYHGNNRMAVLADLNRLDEVVVYQANYLDLYEFDGSIEAEKKMYAFVLKYGHKIEDFEYDGLSV